MIPYLRSPDDCFQDLPDYNFAPNYLELEGTGMRMHYLDEGETNGQPVLFLHGEPSWSYLYRKMILPFVENGYRVIVPDLIGFGKSDKPSRVEDITYQNMQRWLESFVLQLSLQNILLFVQDWGGLLGLRVAMDHPALFAKIAAGNTMLPTAKGQPSAAFEAWKKYVQYSPILEVGSVIEVGTNSHLSAEVARAYEAPFPNEAYKIAVKKLPFLVPTEPGDPEGKINEAYWEKLKSWTKPFGTFFSNKDPITKGGELLFQQLIPGAQHNRHVIIENAAHFLQEDAGEQLALHLLAFFGDKK